MQEYELATGFAIQVLLATFVAFTKGLATVCSIIGKFRGGLYGTSDCRPLILLFEVPIAHIVGNTLALT